MPPSPGGEELSALPAGVDWLEVRADLVGDLDTDWLRSRFGGRLLYSLRSNVEGGNYAGACEDRHERLRRAARSYELIELEGERDCTPELLASIPVKQRVISWRGTVSNLAELEVKFAQLSAVPSRFYKLVTEAAKGHDEFVPLALLKVLRRTDTIAYADGPLGFWSRLVALRLGAPAIFGLVPNGATIPTEPTINKLIEDYALPWLSSPREIYGVVGSPVFHSLSPRLHNAAYRAMNYSALFVPLHVESFIEFWHEVILPDMFATLGLSLKGLTVISPHKEAALQIAEKVSPMARQAESANILVRDNGWWRADTTDPEVVSMARREHNLQVGDKRIAVIGCGGAGRAIAAALNQAGAGITLVNRGAERGEHAAHLLSLPYIPLAGFNAEGYDILVNATPVGRDDDNSPFKVEQVDKEAVVIDLVYGSRPSPLVADALAHERLVIDGREVLLAQVRRQFQMMTGRELPLTPKRALGG
jgi:3-dehydroquinate dehydratase/shikimate dehydrogenase